MNSCDEHEKIPSGSGLEKNVEESKGRAQSFQHLSLHLVNDYTLIKTR